jgi:hypothetical protein
MSTARDADRIVAVLSDGFLIAGISTSDFEGLGDAPTCPW